MEEKVSSLFDDSTSETNNTSTTSDENKVKAIESIADSAVETEIETKTMPEKKVEETKKEEISKDNKDERVKSVDNSKMWTIAVVVSTLILLASAGGMVFVLLRG